MKIKIRTSKNDLIRERNDLIHDIRKLHLKWKLMKFNTETEKEAKNNVCKRLDEMFLKLQKYGE